MPYVKCVQKFVCRGLSEIRESIPETHSAVYKLARKLLPVELWPVGYETEDDMLKNGLEILILKRDAHYDPMPSISRVQQPSRLIRTAGIARKARSHLDLFDHLPLQSAHVVPLLVVQVLSEKFLDRRMKCFCSVLGLGVINITHVEILDHVDYSLAVWRGKDAFPLLL